jgi:release factor glutamine methyltransferase
MNINSLLHKGSSVLKERRIRTYKIDSELILSEIIKKDLTFMSINGDFEISPKEAEIYNDLILRRKNNEPIAYILRKKEFWSIDFDLNQNVLIPRPETEFLVEEVIKKYRHKN